MVKTLWPIQAPFMPPCPLLLERVAQPRCGDLGVTALEE